MITLTSNKLFALMWETTDDSGCEAVFTDYGAAERFQQKCLESDVEEKNGDPDYELLHYYIEPVTLNPSSTD